MQRLTHFLMHCPRQCPKKPPEPRNRRLPAPLPLLPEKRSPHSIASRAHPSSVVAASVARLRLSCVACDSSKSRSCWSSTSSAAGSALAACRLFSTSLPLRRSWLSRQRHWSCLLSLPCRLLHRPSSPSLAMRRARALKSMPQVLASLPPLEIDFHSVFRTRAITYWNSAGPAACQRHPSRSARDAATPTLRVHTHRMWRGGRKLCSSVESPVTGMLILRYWPSFRLFSVFVRKQGPTAQNMMRIRPH